MREVFGDAPSSQQPASQARAAVASRAGASGPERVSGVAVTPAEVEALHVGRFQALATLARRGEWGAVRAYLAAADPAHAEVYRAWLREEGLVVPEETRS